MSETPRIVWSKAAPRSARFDAGRMIRFLLELRSLRFLAVGLLNTFFGYSVFYIAVAVTKHSLLALTISTLAGVAFNFFSIGALVFRSLDRRLIWRFLGVYGVVFAVNAIALCALETLGLNSSLAQALLLPGLAILSYLLNRDFVFVDRKVAGGAA